jgi:two-component system sensor histidine kinase UhpB
VAGKGAIVLTPTPAADIAAIWTQFSDLVLVLAAVFVAGSGLVWLTVGRALRPLADLSGAFARIGGGDYGASVREAGPTELARLARGVNEMAARLAAVQGRNRALEEQILTLQDEERADLARDLHDEIGPHLFAVNLDAALVGRLVDEGRRDEALAQVKSIQGAVAHMQRLVRDILVRLRPTPLVEMGLAAAVEDLVAFWRARHPEIVFDVRLPPDETAMPDAVGEPLYRVVQEGLANAVRHGKPARITVEIDLVGPEALARVTDDGAGGDPAAGGGFGLVGMRERVSAARGALTTGPGPGGGWSVAARIPLQREEAAAP